jgi:hypothetical protein
LSYKNWTNGMSNALSRDVPIAERRGLTDEFRITCDLRRNEKAVG